MKYRSEIDGLRAVAVVPVILFHAGFEAFSGGFVGVDVFFVISGYLITTIILNDLNEGKFSLLNFYERRARRILPALFFVAVCCVPAAWYLLLPSFMEKFSQGLVAVATFSSNILFWRQSGYFNTASELNPLIHTWSLAVEEQFYIFFPLILMTIWGIGRRVVILTLVVAFAISFATAQWGAYNEPSAAFYLLPARAWELFVGSFIAFYLQKNAVRTPYWVNNFLSAVGFAAITLSVFFFDGTTPFPSLYTLLPTLGATLVILFAQRDTWAHKILALRGVVGLGLISYSLYLWHQPVFAFWRHYSLFEPTHVQMLVAAFLSVLLAVLTYYFVETPIRSTQSVLGRKQVFSGSAVMLSLLIAVGLIGHLQRNFELKETYPLDYQPDREPLRTKSWGILRNLAESKSYGNEDNHYDNTLWFDPDDSRHNLLIVGNSHSKDLYNVLFYSNVANENFEMARFGAQIDELNEGFFEVPNYKFSDAIIIVSRLSESDLDALQSLVDRIISDGKTLVVVPNIFKFYDTGLRTLVDIMVLQCIRSSSCGTGELFSSINAAFFKEFEAGLDENPYVESLSSIRDLEEKHPEIIVLDRMKYVCQEEIRRCFAVDQRLNKFFYDYEHHTLEGAKFFATIVDDIGWLAPLVRSLEPK